MPVFLLDDSLDFPDPELADDGLLAVGGDLSPDRLLRAYALGIFPWYEEGLPILWHSPCPRMVLRASELHVSRSLAKRLRAEPFRLTLDVAFRDVVTRCQRAARRGQDGTWITDDMVEAYTLLHERGFTHSVEAWDADALVGGAYGLCLGGVFFGESMFSERTDASKIAFVRLVEQLARWGIELIDCQVPSPHLERFGAVEMPRTEFLRVLRQALLAPNRRGRWRFDEPSLDG